MQALDWYWCEAVTRRQWLLIPRFIQLAIGHRLMSMVSWQPRPYIGHCDGPRSWWFYKRTSAGLARNRLGMLWQDFIILLLHQVLG